MRECESDMHLGISTWTCLSAVFIDLDVSCVIMDDLDHICLGNKLFDWEERCAST